MTDYRYSISLGVTHPTMDLTRVTEALGMQPRALWRVGEARRTPKGAPLSGAYDRAFWTARLVDGSLIERDLQSALTDALGMVEPAAGLIAEINSSGGRTEFFIGWFFNQGSSGDVLDHRFLARVAGMGIDLSFDVYPATAQQPAGQLSS